MTKTDRLRGLARYSNPRSVPDESALPGPANPWVFPLAHGLSARVHADEDVDFAGATARAGASC